MPETAESGLICVKTPQGRSNSVLFSEREQIPVLSGNQESGGTPTISALQANAGAIGSVLAMSGLGFGQAQSGSKVLFTAAGDPDARGADQADAISVSAASPGIILWSDKEIRLLVPDGAASGNILVRTERGDSNQQYFTVSDGPGKKLYRNKKSYSIHYSVTLSRVRSSGDNDFFVWLPQPVESGAQRAVKEIAVEPTPTLRDYHGANLFHFVNLRDNGQDTQAFHDFYVSEYEIQTLPDVEQIKPLGLDSTLQAAYTQNEAGIPVHDPRIQAIAAEITGKEKNLWRQARLIYDYIGANFQMQPKPDSSDVSLTLASKRGDAYAMSLLFVSVSRAAGIPCVPVSGCVVDDKRATRAHWWAEFYVNGLGWIPVDLLYGFTEAGAPSFSKTTHSDQGNKTDYYFGSLDNDRIVFSRGFQALNQQKPGSELKPVKRFYSLQTVTEEIAGEVKSYTSFWSDINVLGVY
jgi:transglutaminase-like putative cysteine protease